MKLTGIEIRNIGIVSDEKVILDKPLNIFAGDYKQGKTTFLNSVRWACGGGFPSDIIKHGEEEAYILLTFDNGSVRREFYKSKSGETKARAIDFIKDGCVVKKAATEIKNYFNPFQLNQNYFTDMSAVDKTRFLTELFNVDTTEEDGKLSEIKKNGTMLRAEIKAYGDIDLTPIERVDVVKLEADKKVITDNNESIERGFKKAKEDFDADVKMRKDAAEDTAKYNQAIIDAEFIIKTSKTKMAEINKTTAKKEVAAPKPFVLDKTDLLDKSISDAALVNYKADQLDERKLKAAEKKTKEALLSGSLKDYKTIEADKAKKLVSLNESHGIEGLVFKEDGSFMFENTSTEMLSTQQQANLSSKLQKMYPESFKVEIIDQGESWGSSIYDLIDKAKSEGKVILVSKVGEKDSAVPEDANVYVVKEGSIQ